jgi:hypothetical protein
MYTVFFNELFRKIQCNIFQIEADFSMKFVVMKTVNYGRESVLTLIFFSDIGISKRTSASYSATSPMAGQRSNMLPGQGFRPLQGKLLMNLEQWWNV